MVYALGYLGIGIVTCLGLLVIAYRDGMEDEQDFGVILFICLAAIFVWTFVLIVIASEKINEAEKKDGVDGGN